MKIFENSAFEIQVETQVETQVFVERRKSTPPSVQVNRESNYRLPLRKKRQTRINRSFPTYT